MNWISGGHSGGVTPGSMPNPAVKPSSADGTAEAIRGRVGRCRKSFFYLFRTETDHRNRLLKSGEFPATTGDPPLFFLCSPDRLVVILRSGFGDDSAASPEGEDLGSVFGLLNCEIPQAMNSGLRDDTIVSSRTERSDGGTCL